MERVVWTEIEELRTLRVSALREKFQDLFGVETRSSNRQYLFRRIAWRLQARAEGDLTERARRRAAELADDADIRLRAPKEFTSQLSASGVPPVPEQWLHRDRRLPPVGTVLTRKHRGQAIVVQVCANGFEYEGRYYRSLSAIAREVTGTRWNGLAFFHLTGRRDG
jgi:hypothetical protein